MEILWMLEKEKYPVKFDDILYDLENNPAYNVIPLTMDIIISMKPFRIWNFMIGP